MILERLAQSMSQVTENTVLGELLASVRQALGLAEPAGRAG